MFTEKAFLNKLRQKLQGKGAISLSTILVNAILMQAGQKGGRLKFGNNF